MDRLDVSRRDGERLDAYVSRLEDLARQVLGAEDRAALAVSLEAARALLRQHQSPSPKPPSDHGHTYRPPSDAGEGLPSALDYCKALYRSLSPEKQAQFLRWLQHGMPD
jgi:hypothetical protein